MLPQGQVFRFAPSVFEENHKFQITKLRSIIDAKFGGCIADPSNGTSMA